MDAPLPFDAKEQVRQATDIVDLVGSYMQLRRQGRGYVGTCPWHDDTRPSMQVNPERQSFKCWVCDIGGDVFSFIMRMENVEFREALELLAERVGISLQSSQGGKPASGGPGDKKALLAAMAWAERELHLCLKNDPKAQAARKYLADRGINTESIDRFQIGFAPNEWDWLLSRSRSQSFSPAVLERVGLVASRQQGQGFYDRFRGRVIFPIRDVRSRPIALGGRILPEFADDRSAKYVNSPETPLYSKSNQLFALDKARDEIQQQSQIVVMEGYTDVIMAFQHGVTNVVACCGTALGENHLQLIRRFTDSIGLVLDGDEAGQKRANDILELFVANQIDLRILTLPENLDPCDFIASPKEGQGVEAFRQLLKNAPDALEFKFQKVTNGMVSSDNTHQASLAVEQVLDTLARSSRRLGDASSTAMIREQSLLSRLARRAGVPEDKLRSRLANLRQTKQAEASRPQYKPKPPARSQPPAKARPQSAEDAFSEAAAEGEESFFAGDASYASSNGGPQASFDQASGQASLGTPTPLERELLELMLLDAQCGREIAMEVTLEGLVTNAGRLLFQACLDSIEVHGEVDFGSLLSELADERLKSLVVEIDESSQNRSGSDREQRLRESLHTYRSKHEAVSRRNERSNFQSGRQDNPEDEAKLSAFFEKLKRRQNGSLSTDG